MIGNAATKYGKKQGIKEKKDRLILLFSERSGICEENEKQERNIVAEKIRRKNYHISFRKTYKGPIFPAIIKPKPELQKINQNSGFKAAQVTKSLDEKKIALDKPTKNAKEPEVEIEKPKRKPMNLKVEPQYPQTVQKNNSIRKEDILEGLSSQRKPAMKDDPLFFEKKDSVKLGFREKISVSFRGSKILNVKIEGRLILSLTQNLKEALLSLSPFWLNPQKIRYQICKNDQISISKRGEESFKVSFLFPKNQGETSLIDYILNPDQFKFSQIPILFIYKYEKSPTDPLLTILNISFRANNNIDYKLKNMVVNLALVSELTFKNIKTSPNSQSMKNGNISWIANEISPKSQGTLKVIFLDLRSALKDVVKGIFVTFQVPIHISEEMKAFISFEGDNARKVPANDPMALLNYQIMHN